MGGGISLLSDVGQDDENLPLGGGFTLVTSGVSYGFDVGPALDIGIGVEIADDFRLQFDLGYTQNDIDTFSGSATILDPAGALFGVVFGTDGEVDQLSLMASAIYEFGDDDSNVRPYVGAGIGGARVSSTLNVTYVDILGNNVSATYETDEWGVAFQGLAGIEFDLSPTSSMTVGYRFLRSDYYSDMDAFNNHSVQAAISFQF
jgi:opacity protein-like surface antigen